ncbi:hypothetical protein AAFF_G00355840 [Aldrovandia affinis]|uniref:Uncharacterized protein n=1 Tax=Aldrovandia affinis TaxID=143900 RepID=A0AAD7R5G2_9TELE|nr:hypothetical protein AAFF_G00355840 [Aldrovandia affinis]
MKWSTGWPGMAQAGLEEAVLDVRHRPRKLHTEKNYLAHNPSRENEPADTDSPTAQAKHYRTLQALWKKPNPNKESVAQLLDLESGARRAFIDSDSIKEEDRHEQIIDAYPCFKDIGHRNPPASSPRKLTGSRKAFHRGGKEMEERDETIQGPVRDEREEDADGRAQSGLERRAQKG